jgi:hypothetical protein
VCQVDLRMGQDGEYSARLFYQVNIEVRLTQANVPCGSRASYVSSRQLSLGSLRGMGVFFLHYPAAQPQDICGAGDSGGLCCAVAL